MTKISVFIITKNEEHRISNTINSVKKIADEIIVVDSGSSDNTMQVCSDLGAKVTFNPWSGYVQQKTFAENLCKNDWILNLDADEALSKELQEEILNIFNSGHQDEYCAYKIKLSIIHRYDNKVRAFAPTNKVIRLYNRKYCGFGENTKTTTHDSVIFKPNVGLVKNKILLLKNIAVHYSGSSIEQLVSKANFYSSAQAKDLYQLDRNFSNLRIFYELFFGFFKAFIIRRYFIFGFNGFIDSVIFAFARFLRLAKLRERRKSLIDANK